MPSIFKVFAEVGRLVFFHHGPAKGKTAIIVDILDHNRALIEGPTTGVPRMVINFKDISLSKLKIDKLARSASSEEVGKAIKAAGIDAKWANTQTAKRFVQKQIRSGLSDFERFQAKSLRYQRNRLIRAEYHKLVSDEYKKIVKPKLEARKKAENHRRISLAIKTRLRFASLVRKKAKKAKKAATAAAAVTKKE